MADTETGKRFAVHAPTGNPKDRLGCLKPPLHLNPPVGALHQAMAQLDGALKYGPFNWRGEKTSYTVYLSALKRHLDALLEGEDYDPVSGVHHAGHIMAGCAILLDADAYGNLIDDRPASNAEGLAKVWARYDGLLKSKGGV